MPSKMKQMCNLASTTETMQRLGWQLSYIKNGFSDGIANWGPKTTRFFFYRTISLVILSLIVFRTSGSRILNQISQPTSSQWTRASFSVSRLTIVQNTFKMQSIVMMRYHCLQDLWHQPTASHAACWHHLARSGHHNSQALLAESRYLAYHGPCTSPAHCSNFITPL